MKLIWHSYIILNLGNCVHETLTETGLTFIVLALTVYLQTIVSETEQGVVASWGFSDSFVLWLPLGSRVLSFLVDNAKAHAVEANAETEYRLRLWMHAATDVRVPWQIGSGTTG